jgi:TPR repeat protein
MYQFGIGMPQDRVRAYRLFDRAEDQGDGQSKFFAQWLRVKTNCIGYRDDKEREIFLFICDEPKGIAFANSHERNMWLSKKKSEFEAKNIHPMDNGYGKGACGAAGGSWGGGGCHGEGGHTFDPSQQDRYGRPLW